MRIVHIICSLADELGGLTRALADLAQAQALAGHQVSVLSLIRAHSPRVLPLGDNHNLRVFEANYNGSLKFPSRLARKLIFQRISGHDIVHIHGIWRYHSQAASRAARWHGLPYVVSPHGSLDRFCRAEVRWLKAPYFRFFEKPVLNRAAGIHCCSEKEREEIADLKLKAPLFVVPNAVEAGLLTQSPDYQALAAAIPQWRPERKTILFLGRFDHKKRIDLIVESFAKLAPQFDDWQLVLAGLHEEPAVVQRVASLVDAHGLTNRVFLPGIIRGAARIALFRSTSIMAYASESENFCIALAEATVFGIPVVATREVALARDVAEAGAGICCECTVEAFNDALRSLVSNPKLRAEQGQAARVLSERFLGMRVAGAFIEQYQLDIDRHANPARYSRA